MPSINPPSDRLGRENAVLSGRGSRYYVPDFEGCLSVKTVIDGTATWETENRRFVLDEDRWLVLNDRQRYTITIDSIRPVTTFCLFFERGFVEEVYRAQVTPSEVLLDSPQPSRMHAVEFVTRIESPDGPLAFLRRFHRELSAGRITEIEWESNFLKAAEVLTLSRSDMLSAIARVPAQRNSTRLELYRRLARGRDFLLSSLDEPIRLHDMARAACLSPFHFHRAFSRAFGETPHQCLTRHRLQRAAKLLCETDLSITEICLATGFESAASFSELFRRHHNVSPRKFSKIREDNPLSSV